MKLILGLMILMCPIIAWAQTPSVGQLMSSQEQIERNNKLMNQINSAPHKILLRSITLNGFRIQNDEKLQHMLSSYRKKYFTTTEIDELIERVQDFYTEAGYNDLVEISHTLKRGKLVINVVLKHT